MFQTRWFKALITICGVLLVVALCIEVYSRLEKRGQRIVAAHPIDARIEISNPPPWLDRRIVAHLLDEAYQHVQKDRATYDRARNVLDAALLTEIAGIYTGAQTVDGKDKNGQEIGYNAWIKKVTEVRRDLEMDKSQQTIRIYAEWRSPAAWIRVDAPSPATATGTAPATAPAIATPASTFYLIDTEGVRLPGEYHAADRTGAGLMTLTAIEMPTADGDTVPTPGNKWTAGKGSVLGDDLVAGMQLVDALTRQRFARQVDAINMSNFKGKKDPQAAWIELETVWRKADGSPRTVEWGRPIGEEKYYEVQAPVKIQRLNNFYAQFNRIDAGRDYVDIRFDWTMFPKIASEAPELATPAAHG